MFNTDRLRSNIMSKSSIEWTEETWNPTTGCSKISTGCQFCYAQVMSRRLKAMGIAKYQNGKDGFAITEHYDSLHLPYSWKKPRTVFVNSMSDLFHKGVSDLFIKRVFDVMNECPQHTFQVLTKRASRLPLIADQLTWSNNIWLGVSIENERWLRRIAPLCATPAAVKFLSCEPLLGPLHDIDLSGIDWVIVGGESGRSPRPMMESWVQDIREQCEQSNTAFFFKQWGGRNKQISGRLLNGRTYDAMPVIAKGVSV